MLKFAAEFSKDSIGGMLIHLGPIKGVLLAMTALGTLSGCAFLDSVNFLKDEPEPVDYSVTTASIDNAKSSLDYFVVCLRQGDGDEFRAKVNLGGVKGRESLWLGQVRRLSSTQFVGVLRQTPKSAKQFKKGKPINFERSQIIDWIIFRDKQKIGGFTENL